MEKIFDFNPFFLSVYFAGAITLSIIFNPVIIVVAFGLLLIVLTVLRINKGPRNRVSEFLSLTGGFIMVAGGILMYNMYPDALKFVLAIGAIFLLMSNGFRSSKP